MMRSRYFLLDCVFEGDHEVTFNKKQSYSKIIFHFALLKFVLMLTAYVLLKMEVREILFSSQFLSQSIPAMTRQFLLQWEVTLFSVLRRQNNISLPQNQRLIPSQNQPLHPQVCSQNTIITSTGLILLAVLILKKRQQVRDALSFGRNILRY